MNIQTVPTQKEERNLSGTMSVSTLQEMISRVCHAVDQCEDYFPTADLEKVIKPFLGRPELLDGIRLNAVEGGYDRTVLYADPDGRFTLLALSWSPGAQTPIHGHHAWGTVGIHSGTLGVACYDKHMSDEGTVVLAQTKDLQCQAGDIASVHPDPEGIHKIYNDSQGQSVSIHVYGMDLTEQPGGINKVYVR